MLRNGGFETKAIKNRIWKLPTFKKGEKKK